MAVSSSSAEPPGFSPQPWGGTSAGFLRDSFSPLTQGFDAYVLKVAAAATQAWWQMADLQASAGQTGVHFPTFFLPECFRGRLSSAEELLLVRERNRG